MYYDLAFGSFNRRNDCFSIGWIKEVEFALGQSNCIVIVAWMYHFKYKPYEWNVSHLDNIICKGDRLQFTLLCDNEMEPRRSERLENIRAACIFSREHFNFEPLIQSSFFGKFTGLRTKLKNYMKRCDENSRSVILICKQISFGIFGYTGRNGEIEYCLFDPHGRNSNGFFDYTANSCVMIFKTIDNLMNLLARDALFTHCRYECVPIKKSIKLKKSHYVIVHNSEQFLKEYCRDGTNWAESSGSSDEVSSNEDTDDDGMEDDNVAVNDGDTIDDVSVVQTEPCNRRISRPPERYVPASHPSFFRGKLREDLKRSKGKWKKWYDARDSEQKKTYNERKKYLWARNQLISKSNK